MRMDVQVVKERIKVARKKLGYSQSDVARMQRIAPYNICRMETGETYPSLQYLNFLQHNGINLNWIFSGEGEMITVEHPPSSSTTLV